MSSLELLIILGILGFLALFAMLRYGDKIDLSLKGPGGVGIDIKGERKWEQPRPSAGYNRPSLLQTVEWKRYIRVSVLLAIIVGAYFYRDPLISSGNDLFDRASELYDDYYGKDITVESDGRTFLLQNISDKTLNLDKLAVSVYTGCPETNSGDSNAPYAGSGGSCYSDTRLSQYFSAPLERFEPNMCLLGWIIQTDYPPEAPDTCEEVFTLVLDQDNPFWGALSKSLFVDDARAEDEEYCQSSNTECKFNVPDFLVVSQ